MEQQIFDLRQKEEVVRYITLRDYANRPFIVEDISTGNMNYVYRIRETLTGRTFVLKYAAKHTRISEDIPVSIERIQVEAAVIEELNQYVPQFVPQIYHYDALNQCILMKDYFDFSILRDKLNQCDIIPDFAENITDYLTQSIIPVLNITDEEGLQDRVVPKLQNPLCRTTETFVFSEPFDPQSSTNDIFELSFDLIESEVFKDHELLRQIRSLKDEFVTKKQAIIHGDLHTGSIFVKNSSVIIFDYEFAFYGPIGFDLGNLIANLVFAWLHAIAFRENINFINWVEQTITQLVDEFKNKLLNGLTSRSHQGGTVPMETDIFIDDIIHDAAAFAGVELLRRIIGIAHVKDIVSIDPPTDRMKAEKIAVRLAKQWIINKKEFNKGYDFKKGLVEVQW